MAAGWGASFFQNYKKQFKLPLPQLTNHHGQRHHTETPQTKIKNLTQDLSGISLIKKNSEVPATVTLPTTSVASLDYFKEFINPDRDHS